MQGVLGDARLWLVRPTGDEQMAQPPGKKLFGEILVEKGHCTKEQVDHALTVQKDAPRHLGLIMIDLGYVSEEQVRDGLEARYRLHDVLVEWGYLTWEQMEEALNDHKVTGKRLGQILVDKGLLHHEDVAGVLAEAQRREMG